VAVVVAVAAGLPMSPGFAITAKTSARCDNRKRKESHAVGPCI
jgi:hypothetical protein